MIKISQSLMKDFKKYFYSAYSSSEKVYEGNNCGLLLKAKYIDKKISIQPTDSMAEGIYFEFMATGSLPKSGIPPQPEVTKNGSLTAGYQRAQSSARFFTQLIEHFDIKILEKAYVLQNDYMIGTLDLLVEWDNRPCIIDMKFSGLLEDKWSELGWNTDTLPTKEQLMIQGVHYKLLAREVMDMDLPFFFWVFNSKDPTDMKIIQQEVDEDYFDIHKADVLKTKELIEMEIEKGFKPFPSYKNCKSCPLNAECPHRELFPKPVTVYYNGNV